MLSRNYQVFTGTQLHNDFGITVVDGRNLEKDQLFGMLFVTNVVNEGHFPGDKCSTIVGPIYGPYFQSIEAQRWCNNLNKLFKELRSELGK